MKKIILAAVAALLMSGAAVQAVKSPVDYVNPLMGTMSTFELSTGNTYPATALPWGMNFWTPQTGRNGDGWIYNYTATKIRGIKQTHQPSPWIGDYGAFSFLPTVGKPVFNEEKRQSWFSHKAETSKPYLYKVYLADYDATVELTPTERAAVVRVTYPKTDEARFVVDAYDGGSYVKIIPSEQKIIGYSTNNHGGVADNFRCYFVITFDHPFAYTATVSRSDSISASALETSDAQHAGAIVGFKTAKRGEQVIARVASSFISAEQAERNLLEVSGKSFDKVLADARQRWNDVLSRIEVDDDDVDALRTFYSCLYRSVLFPRSFFEIGADGKPIHYSPYNGKVEKGYMFTDTGFWDTFRSLFPLVNLVYPSMGEKMQAGLVCDYIESGFLPEWASPGHRDCMVGNNSASIVADAYAMGLRGYDAEKLWQAVTHGANSQHPRVRSTGRLGYEYYNELGYVPYDAGINESVARTLEYAYDDWCILQLGRALGKPESELAPYRRHAMNYRNVFDPETRLMRGRMKSGAFQSPFNPLKWGDAFTEGNAWHYTWSVFHDIHGLISLMGGREAFAQMLDSVFLLPPAFDDSYYGGVIHEIREMQIMNMGNYAHGNQPIQHMIYLYSYALEPWKAQYWVREVMNRLYSATPDGYCGDEDNGQTSAWYVFSALGFYPVCPASGQYVMAAPRFRSVKLHLENGRTVSILAKKPAGTDSRYIRRMSIDGKAYDRNYITHEQLSRGGEISIEMSDKPNLKRGTSPSSAPYSFSLEDKGK